MPARRKINLEKAKASLSKLCPQCGHEITPAEVLRINSTQLRCPKVRSHFHHKRVSLNRGILAEKQLFHI
jgi:predicted RNA-binding Zn-ribbon protein involved in translation (DUF1610 family)